MALPAAAAVGCWNNTPRPVVARTTNITVERSYTSPPTAIGGGPKSDIDSPVRLDAARAGRLIEARKQELRNDCYAPYAGVTSFLVDVSVAPDGRVERASTSLVNGDGNVAECVRERVEKLTFPRATEGSTHTFTFLFGR